MSPSPGPPGRVKGRRKAMSLVPGLPSPQPSPQSCLGIIWKEPFCSHKVAMEAIQILSERSLSDVDASLIVFVVVVVTIWFRNYVPDIALHSPLTLLCSPQQASGSETVCEGVQVPQEEKGEHTAHRRSWAGSSQSETFEPETKTTVSSGSRTLCRNVRQRSVVPFAQSSF